jgi:transcriptional regulator with XRE-family HTH domain
MTSPSKQPEMANRERAEYGVARAKHIAFDAVCALWRRRQNEGMRQLDIAEFTGQSPSTVSRNLRGPGNWTLRTLGQYVEALDGELEIIVHAIEDPPSMRGNYNAYEDFEPEHNKAESGRATPIDDTSLLVTTTT